MATPVIGISVGDVNGIGPEIILKALNELDLTHSTPVIFAPKEIISYYKNNALNALVNVPESHIVAVDGSIKEQFLNIDPIPLLAPAEPGKLTKESGKMAMISIEKGIEFAMKGIINALVTAPISKEAVNLAGYFIPGHTEFLADKTNTEMVLMMLVHENLRVALVTAHVPIKDITRNIDPELIIKKARILYKSLKDDFQIKHPRIAVFGLNPHAGDGGVIGNEELRIIIPAIGQLQNMGINAKGPFAADGFFGNKLYEEFDAILAMYHDQGLVPFKLLSFVKGVNFTAGLPIIRTSPDHGTAFDIAGKGVANPSSFLEAYNLAVQLAEIQK